VQHRVELAVVADDHHALAQLTVGDGRHEEPRLLTSCGTFTLPRLAGSEKPLTTANLPRGPVMRSLLLPACALLLGLAAYRGGQPAPQTVKVRLKLVDAATGKGVGGTVRLFPEGKDEPLPLPGLFDRLRGLKPGREDRGWSVVPARGAQTTLPRARLRLEALSGLESALARQEIDLRNKAPDEVVVKLPFLFRPDREKLAAGNT